MNKRMTFELYLHMTKFLSAFYQICKQFFYFLKCLLNGIFNLTGTDIFASFIREMIYKRRIISLKHIRRNARCSSGKLILLFHYILCRL